MTDDTIPLSPRPLSPRHERFVAEFLKDGNATQAYIRAGYLPRGAQPCASRLLRIPGIEAAIAAGRQRIAQALEIDVGRLAQEYAKIAFASVDDFVSVDDDGNLRIDLTKANQAQRAGIVELRVRSHSKQEQSVTLKLGKLQALAALTRHVSLFAQRPEPGLTPEDRARYEARIAEHEANWEHSMSERRRLTRERDAAEIALAAAQAKLAAAARSSPPEAEAPPPQASQTIATQAPRDAEPDLSVVPGERLICRVHQHPGTIDSAEALRRMKPGGFPGYG